MHWEIIGTGYQIAVLAAKLRQPAPVPVQPKPVPAPHPSLSLPPVRSRPVSFQRWYNAYPFRPALLPIISPVANNFGPQSEAALRKVQARYGLVADAIDGPKTKRVLWDLGWRG
jgi:peptidoglycan hydrolase-like protein with peptidoglycan-binding domain